MNKYIKRIINSIDERDTMERSIQDLRLLIERCTMNRYGNEDEYEYSILFSDRTLLDQRLTLEELEEIKIEIFYLLLRYSKYSILFAKCIKVFFDVDLWEPIRKCIYLYIKEYDTVCELIFAITNSGAPWWLDNDNYILFSDISKNGLEQSRNLALEKLKYFTSHPY